MTKKELMDHKVVISQMDWDDLAISIIEMEMEIYELEESMTQKELKDRYKLLKLYENEKQKRVENESKGSIYVGMVYGENYATDWNDEEY